MKAEYQRSLAHCYMILSEDGCEVSDNYQIRILASSGIDGILPVAEEHIDNVQRFRYEITSLMPFRDFCETRRFRVEDLRTLFGGILETLIKAEDYLLETEHLLLDPDYLYVSWDTGRLWAAYDPFHRKEIRQGLTELTEYLLIKIGHGNQEAVVLTCRFLHSLQEINLGYPELMKLLEQGVSQKEGHGAEGDVVSSSYPGDRSWEHETGKVPDRGSQDTPYERNEKAKYRYSDSGDTFQIDALELDAGLVLNPLLDTEDRKASWLPEKETVITAIVLIPVACGLFLLLQIQTYLTLSRRESMACAGAFVVAVILSLVLSKRMRQRKKNSPYKDRCSAGVKRNAKEDSVSEDTCFVDGKRNRSSDSGCATYSEQEEFQNWYGGAEDADELRAEHTMLLGSIRFEETGEKEWLLVPVHAADQLPTIPLTGSELLIGKTGGPSDCPIPDPTVSRVHARLIKKDGVWYVCDMSSRNGTVVDGKKAVGREELPLTAGSKVEFARCEYEVQVKALR